VRQTSDATLYAIFNFSNFVHCPDQPIPLRTFFLPCQNVLHVSFV
jgi:hypothetical protein